MDIHILLERLVYIQNLQLRMFLQIFLLYDHLTVSNSNWTEWSSIQGVIARVISKLKEHEVQILINRIYNKFRNEKCLLRTSFERKH